MSNLLTYAHSDSISVITMDDGKVNAMSPSMLRELHEAFDKAEADKSVVILTGKENIFSAGFDLTVFSNGNAEEIHSMLKLGAELAERVMSFPTPVVTACNGNAYPMGAFLMLAADFRIGVEGPFKIGLNEVSIGLTVPLFAIEIARQRLTPAYFNRTAVTGEMFSPNEAVTAGFLDRTVSASDLDSEAREAAARLCKLDMTAHAATKMRARGPALKALRAAIEAEITLENAQ